MTQRKLPESFKEKIYIEGYLHDKVKAGRVPDYGYRENHLPKLRDRERETQSLFDIALQQE